MAISDFWYFVILTRHDFKNIFFVFWMNKKDHKIKNFENFQKPYYMLKWPSHLNISFELR